MHGALRRHRSRLPGLTPRLLAASLPRDSAARVDQTPALGMNSLTVLVAVTVLAGWNVCISLQCPSGFEHHGNSCYKILQDLVSWENARVRCQSLGFGSDLASIAEMAEFDFLRGFVSRQRDRFRNSGDEWLVAWVGAEDFEREGDFRWSYGRERVDARMWAPTQPDNHQDKEDCVGMFLNRDGSRLNDQDCTLRQLALCEKPDWN